jgi:cyclopropane fatty-acyl-phospholipid synthase-like methyltransferase
MNANIRSLFYDNIIYFTPKLYKKILKKYVEPGSTILEVGIGNGNCIEKNKEFIIKNNYKIDGIDIDEEYLQVCEKRIINNHLEKYVSCKNQNLLTMKDNKKYDYIFFMESYPVISEELMTNMLNKCRNILSEDGKIVYCHNLVKTKNPFINLLKPNIKYFLGNVDFGRLTTHEEFENLMKVSKAKIIKKDRIMYKKILGYEMDTYCIICYV